MFRSPIPKNREHLFVYELTFHEDGKIFCFASIYKKESSFLFKESKILVKKYLNKIKKEPVFKPGFKNSVAVGLVIIGVIKMGPVFSQKNQEANIAVIQNVRDQREQSRVSFIQKHLTPSHLNPYTLVDKKFFFNKSYLILVHY